MDNGAPFPPGPAKQLRNHTLFFVGNVLRAEALAGPHAALRPLVVDRLADVFPPNILADTHPASSRPECVPPAVMTGCHMPALSGEAVGSLMQRSLFSLHVRGDDAGSSRVETAVAGGTPQLFLAGRYVVDVAAFPCTVPWSDMVVWLKDDEFLDHPEATARKALRDFIVGRAEEGGRRWRRMWHLQDEARRDLLWHVEGSRVGHNILLDAGRLLRTRGLLPVPSPLSLAAEG